MGTARVKDSAPLCAKRYDLERRLAKGGHRWPSGLKVLPGQAMSGFELVVRLWGWLDGRSDPSGRLHDVTPEDIEAAAGWDGQEGLLWACLLASRWIDKEEEGYRWHDYHMMNGLTIKDRNKKRDKRGDARGDRMGDNQGDETGDAEGDKRGASGSGSGSGSESGSRSGGEERRARARGASQPHPTGLDPAGVIQACRRLYEGRFLTPVWEPASDDRSVSEARFQALVDKIGDDQTQAWFREWLALDHGPTTRFPHLYRFLNWADERLSSAAGERGFATTDAIEAPTDDGIFRRREALRAWREAGLNTEADEKEARWRAVGLTC